MRKIANYYFFCFKLPVGYKAELVDLDKNRLLKNGEKII